MHYEIRLKIQYDYQSGASHSRHHLRIMPAHIEGRQHRKLAQITIDPGSDEREDFTDFFGNHVTGLAFHETHQSPVFSMNADVTCFEPTEALDISPLRSDLASEIRSISHLLGDAPHHYLSNSPFVRVSDAFYDYAIEKCDGAETVMECVRKIGLGLYEDMSFDAEATTVNTPVEQSFAEKRGVCQDYSHIMIAILRSIGIPAGYVSGFIRTIPPEGQERLDGADAMHAWVKAWCGAQMGWVEFDPTNGIAVATDHIIVGSGRDYDDVAPVKGILKAHGAHSTTQAVDVIPKGESKKEALSQNGALVSPV